MNEESVSLLPVTRRSFKASKHAEARFCINSRAACLILLWNFSILLGSQIFYNTNAVMQVSYSQFIPIITNTTLSAIAVFAPMIGILADIKISRYKAVLRSSYVILIEVLLTPTIVALLLAVLKIKNYSDFGPHHCKVCLLLYILGVLYSAVVAITFVVFLINGFQFGMDQLHDSSTEDLILYIHWYVWVYYATSLITDLPWNLVFYDVLIFDYIDTIRISGYSMAFLVFIATLLLLIFSLCVMRHRKPWFLLEPAGVNPYKLVYRVLKFAYRHKVPLNRSAFTYCEDEVPSRLDLGKGKFGGPFTIRQVEDIKAFLGILKVLLSIGPIFFLQTALQSMLPAFARHGNVFFRNESGLHQVYVEGVIRHIFISNGLLSPLLITILIPLYLWLIRPRILYHVPGMLKRIGVGIGLIILALLSAFVMDFMIHAHKTEYANCMFTVYTNIFRKNYQYNVEYSSPPLFQNIYFFTSLYITTSLIDVLIDIAVLEFICSQSPYSMKGLLLGLFFSLRSLFQALAIISIVPFGAWWKTDYALSCGSGFYLVNIIVAVLTLGLFSYVAKRYRYRIMNEPSNEYRYAEEYYSSKQ